MREILRIAVVIVSVLTIGKVLLVLPDIEFVQEGALANPAKDIREVADSPTAGTLSFSNDDRVQHLRNFCSNIPQSETNDNLQTVGANKFYAVDRLKALFCVLPKAGSTSTRLFLMKLASNSERVEKYPGLVPLKTRHVVTIEEGTEVGDMLEKYADYTKILTVRHPLNRIISAYKNKLFDQTLANSMSLIKNRQRMFRRRKKMNTTYLNSDPVFKSRLTFEEFALYLTQVPPDNNHWISQYNLSMPCTIQYDIINTVESLHSDIPNLLHKLNASQSLTLPTENKSKAAELNMTNEEYLSSLSPGLIQDLKKLYARDFDAFGYSYTE